MMAYLSDWHYCCDCGNYLGIENGDGICGECEMKCGVCRCELDDNNTTSLCPSCSEREYNITHWVTEESNKI